MVSIIYSTFGNIEEARKIARALVNDKIVACVNIIPKIESIYNWKGKVEEDDECVIIAKTTDENIEKTITKIKSLQSYELPDIIAIPITTGFKDYIDWIKDETV